MGEIVTNVATWVERLYARATIEKKEKQCGRGANIIISRSYFGVYGSPHVQ